MRQRGSLVEAPENWVPRAPGTMVWIFVVAVTVGRLPSWGPGLAVVGAVVDRAVMRGLAKGAAHVASGPGLLALGLLAGCARSSPSQVAQIFHLARNQPPCLLPMCSCMSCRLDNHVPLLQRRHP